MDDPPPRAISLAHSSWASAERDPGSSQVESSAIIITNSQIVESSINAMQLEFPVVSRDTKMEIPGQ